MFKNGVAKLHKKATVSKPNLPQVCIHGETCLLMAAPGIVSRMVYPIELQETAIQGSSQPVQYNS